MSKSEDKVSDPATVVNASNVREFSEAVSRLSHDPTAIVGSIFGVAAVAIVFLSIAGRAKTGHWIVVVMLGTLWAVMATFYKPPKPPMEYVWERQGETNGRLWVTLGCTAQGSTEAVCDRVHLGDRILVGVSGTGQVMYRRQNQEQTQGTTVEFSDDRRRAKVIGWGACAKTAQHLEELSVIVHDCVGRPALAQSE